jgi:hypothetical protein
MGLFAFAGALRQGSTSRLGYLVFSERKLFWVSFLAGVLLISNASLPPFPSFFSRALNCNKFRNENILGWSFCGFKTDSMFLQYVCIHIG